MLTDEARQAAKSAGRRMAVGAPGVMAAAFAEIAEAGAIAAVRVQAQTPDRRGVPQHGFIDLSFMPRLEAER